MLRNGLLVFAALCGALCNAQTVTFVFNTNGMWSGYDYGAVGSDPTTSFANNCIFVYSESAHEMGLIKDNGTDYYPFVGANNDLGGPNSRCGIFFNSYSTSGNTLTIQVTYSFAPTYTGTYTVWTNADAGSWVNAGTAFLKALTWYSGSVYNEESSATVSGADIAITGISFTLSTPGTTGAPGTPDVCLAAGNSSFALVTAAFSELMCWHAIIQSNSTDSGRYTWTVFVDLSSTPLSMPSSTSFAMGGAMGWGDGSSCSGGATACTFLFDSVLTTVPASSVSTLYRSLRLPYVDMNQQVDNNSLLKETSEYPLSIVAAQLYDAMNVGDSSTVTLDELTSDGLTVVRSEPFATQSTSSGTNYLSPALSTFSGWNVGSGDLVNLSASGTYGDVAAYLLVPVRSGHTNIFYNYAFMPSANVNYICSVYGNSNYSIGNGLTNISVSSNVATATVSSTSALSLYDQVAVTGSTTAGVNVAATPILSIPNGTTFTYADTVGNGTYNNSGLTITAIRNNAGLTASQCEALYPQN